MLALRFPRGYQEPVAICGWARKRRGKVLHEDLTRSVTVKVHLGVVGLSPQILVPGKTLGSGRNL